MARDDHPPGHRERYERGLDDYHDPTAGFGGAPPARSALTLRLILAGFGFVISAVITFLAARADLTWLMIIGVVLATIAAIDIVWVAQRKRRGEPG
ncbi:MAG TPA: DUF6343 family protein [Jiangellaceae bacterium]|nr:DUF6343 family protein [Jiangellaceae bacterium]